MSVTWHDPAPEGGERDPLAWLLSEELQWFPEAKGSQPPRVCPLSELVRVVAEGLSCESELPRFSSCFNRELSG